MVDIEKPELMLEFNKLMFRSAHSYKFSMEITKKDLEKCENKVEKSKLSGLYRSKSEMLKDKSNYISF